MWDIAGPERSAVFLEQPPDDALFHDIDDYGDPGDDESGGPFDISGEVFEDEVDDEED